MADSQALISNLIRGHFYHPSVYKLESLTETGQLFRSGKVFQCPYFVQTQASKRRVRGLKTCSTLSFVVSSCSYVLVCSVQVQVCLFVVCVGGSYSLEFLNYFYGSQVAERVGHRASNLKVASSIPGRCT